MELPENVILLATQPDEYSLVLASFAANHVRARSVQDPFHLVSAFSDDPAETVILDIDQCPEHLPQLISALRERNPQVAVIVIFSAQQRDRAAEALCKGADILLLKPVSSAEVIAALERTRKRPRPPEKTPLEGAPPKQADADVLARFALGVAHEINNPLTTISGWLQMLIADSSGDKKTVEMLKSVNEEADRIADIVRQLLTVAQLSPPHADKVHVPKLLDELRRFHQKKMRSDGITVEAEIPPKLAPVRGDFAQLRQACDTILSEARASLNGTGAIRIACRDLRDHVEITFHDDGPPMSEEQIARLFDPFEFGRNANGAGLGLCLADSIIRSHGGDISVKSSKAGGTDYIIRLPAAGGEGKHG